MMGLGEEVYRVQYSQGVLSNSEDKNYIMY